MQFKAGTAEINVGPSESHRGATSITIFAVHWDEVEEWIVTFYKEYGQRAHFTNPAQCADGRWGAYGRIA